jgi:ABC-2 type transport system ATP-binding protein
VIVIDKGQLIYDGDLRALVKQMHPSKLVSFTLSGPVTPDELERMGEVVSAEGGRVVLRVPQNRLRDVVGHSLSALPLSDLSIEDPPVEDIMRQLFQHAGHGEDRETAASGPTG